METTWQGTRIRTCSLRWAGQALPNHCSGRVRSVTVQAPDSVGPHPAFLLLPCRLTTSKCPLQHSNPTTPFRWALGTYYPSTPQNPSTCERNSVAKSFLTYTAKMPPKKTDKGPSKKLDAKKAVDDKTFGMKNKKGGAAQRQISQLQSQMKAGGNAEQKKKEAERAQREKEKKAAEEAKREADLLLNKPAQIQKVPFGVDPKTVLCIFYKKGNCEKGKKCKFSHDMELDRKTEKKSLYTDTRAEEEEKKKAETSADWDEDKLRSVVLSKKGNQRTTTDKVCKYFIQAIEDGKYGWFWICPNGGDKCMYKHALPPG